MNRAAPQDDGAQGHRAAGLVLVLAVAIGWSRVVLGRHTLPEVLAGASLGVLVSTALSVVLERL